MAMSVTPGIWYIVRIAVNLSLLLVRKRRYVFRLALTSWMVVVLPPECLLLEDVTISPRSIGTDLSFRRSWVR